MNPFLEVISAGLYTSIQDKGRFGFRKYGVPVSGAMDDQSSALANHLLNNSPDNAVMEITIIGPKLWFSTSTLISISGADLSPKINESPIQTNKAISIKKGDILSFGHPKIGARCYLAVKGGFQTERIMNSYSFFSPITKSKTLTKGDKVSIESFSPAHEHLTSVKVDESLFNSVFLECTTGPELELSEAGSQIFQKQFSISQENNRMGYRLDGPPLRYPKDYNMLTSSVLPGTVQLTPAGKLIALMKDCQTTGGYPRILQLSSDGINKLAQKKAGDIISFRPVS